MTRYVALLRAINVGGKNLLKMDALRNVFQSAGLKNVRTFQQSGNVVFDATRIKKDLFQSLNLKTNVIVLSLSDLKQIIDSDPFKKVAAGDVMLCVAFFLDEPTAKPALPLISQAERLELIAVDERAAFVVARRKKTGWFGFPNNFVEKQLGVTATTRQWSTIKKLLAFAEKD